MNEQVVFFLQILIFNCNIPYESECNYHGVLFTSVICKDLFTLIIFSLIYFFNVFSLILLQIQAAVFTQQKDGGSVPLNVLSK